MYESVLPRVASPSIVHMIVDTTKGFGRLRSGILVFSILLGLSVTSLRAQESEQENGERETVRTAVQAPHDQGVYKNINRLPEEIRRSAPFARSLFELERVVGKGTSFDQSVRMKAFELSQQQLQVESYKMLKSNKGDQPFADAWTSIGPYHTGGNTTAIAVDPSNGTTVYAGATGGGVWKSTNQGSAWVPLTDNVIPNLAVASIAIDPSHTQTIYVGTGSGYASIDEVIGSGVYKSVDGGATWSHIGQTTLTGTIIKVFVDPNNSNIVLASQYSGGNRALYRSTDAGSTWAKVFPTGATAQGVVWDIAAANVVSGSQILYMIEGNMIYGNSQECGIYKSVNDGQTWTKITTGFVPRGDSIGRAAIAVPTANTSTVYALMALPDGNFKGLYRSTNGGGSFSRITTTPTTLFRPSSQFPPQGWYDVYLAVDPKATSNRAIYIGGVEGWQSTNDGTSWRQYSGYTQETSNIHVDHHAVAIDPTNSSKVYIGTDGGIYRTVNAGTSWISLNNNYVTTQFYHIALDKADNTITWAGAQDNGTWLNLTNSNPKEYTQLGGDGFQPVVSTTDHNVVYGELPQGDIYKATDGLSTGFSGATFDPITSGTMTQESAYWDAPLRMAPFNSNTLYSGRTKVWKTTDGGQNWSAISSNLQNDVIRTLALSSANSQVIWVGYSGGNIYMTNNGGANWNAKTANANGGSVTYIVTHPTNANFALASFGVSGSGQPRVMVTTDQGTTWTNVSGSGTTGLPEVSVNGLAIDSVNPSTRWYAATDNGIYYTLNAGQTWSVAGSGLGLVACRDVQIHANKTTIRVATFGRGLWQANANILPVELEGFTGVETQDGTRLSWKTDSEHNSQAFHVMRSYNYGPFEDVHIEPAAGSSNTVHYYQWLDAKKDTGDYIYQLKEVDLNGTEHFSNIVEVRYGPVSFRLDQNYPNPFPASVSGGTNLTHIRFSVPDAGNASLTIYDASGKAVQTLFKDHTFTRGEQDAYWDGKDVSGNYVAAGAYFYVLQLANGSQLLNKMMVIR